MPKRKGLKHHLIHKSRLGLLLIIKIILAFVCFFLGGYVGLLLKDVFGEVFTWLIIFPLIFVLYLFIVIKILHLLKFE